jgi:NAD(P)H dehydrogenase (quinone)
MHTRVDQHQLDPRSRPRSIVVTTISGNLGRLIVKDLLDRDVPATDVFAGARSLDAVTDLADRGVRTAVIDNDDPATLEATLHTWDTFILISGKDLASRDRPTPSPPPSAPKQAASSTSAASRPQRSPSPIAASHAVTENAVHASGIPFTILRNG